MPGGILLCVPVSSVEAARRGRLAHGKVEVPHVLLAQDVLHHAVIRHQSVFVVFVCQSHRWLFVMVHGFRGGNRYLKHLELYLHGPMFGDLRRQVLLSRPRYLKVCRFCVSEVHAGIC